MPSQPVLLDTNTIIDISHESLIRRWVRLGEWVEAEHNLRPGVQAHARVSHTLEVWQGCALANTRSRDWPGLTCFRRPRPAWAERYGGQFDITIEFLEQSAQEQERQQQLSQAQIKRELA